MTTTHPILRNDFERYVNTYWDTKRDDVLNLRTGSDDGLYHHHFGIGDYDPAVLDTSEDIREEAILAEMHRLENEQVRVILDALGPLGPGDRVMDAGCGRGGTSFLIAQHFGCRVEGVNFSPYQVDFARRLAARRGWSDRVGFSCQNMVTTGFPDACFQRVVSNETTMYVDLDEAFAEFARVLVPGGGYVLTTWSGNDSIVPYAPQIPVIDEHYACHVHRRSTYLQTLLAHDLVPVKVWDFTTEAIPYWELRMHSKHRSGIEEAYLDGHRTAAVNYLVVVAEKAAE